MCPLPRAHALELAFALAHASTPGPVSGVEGLFVAAGHEGSGLTLGPATGELISDYVLGKKGSLPSAVVAALAPALAAG
jgi:glycine/D-amino acid oxidase-like deaminating enzyme